MIAVIFIAGCLVLGVGYIFYGRCLSRWLGVEPGRPTPAHDVNDGVDFVPAHAPVLFGHHFSSIAGAGPIVGPVLAAIWFGWQPTVLWILFGAVLIGGVHDYASLIASIRHGGGSIGEICKKHLNPLTYRAFLIFIFFTLVYVLIVFLDLTAATFAPANLTDAVACDRGGAVATSSLIYVLLAVGFGLVTRSGKVNFKTATCVFVPLIFAAMWVGVKMPMSPRFVPAVFYDHPKYTWAVILLAYCFAASVTPVWVLLQPRDYLSSFLLYGCLLGGVAGIVVLALTGQADIQQSAWRMTAEVGGKSVFIFPTLFITVACGAVSGFHSVVASGTSARQLNREEDAKPIAYGGMLVEGVLALVAVSAVMLLPAGDPLLKAHPVKVFAAGMGRFLSVFHITPPAGELFGLLAVSTFLLTTLDTATRLARFILAELLNLKKPAWRYVTTALTIALPAVIVFIRMPNRAVPGTFLPAWQAIWPAFGTTNQLLAALALLVVFIWLGKEKRPRWFAGLPMVFMFATTLVGLAQLVKTNMLNEGGQALIGLICLALLILSLLVVGNTIVRWRKTCG
ncbi:MAG: carbon starvation CstA family protein [Lentisphaeria bacterium]|nr:carbon starvation CstA family protein [Lentisphaeria bacterium]